MKLENARRRAGLTQAALASKARVDQQTISRIETHQIKSPSHRTVRAVCLALGIELELTGIDEFDNGGGRL